VAAAVARGQLASTAAKQLAVPMPRLRIENGVITGPDGRKLTYGSLARDAAVARTRAVEARLKPRTAHSIVGTPQRRIDAHAAVTGKKKFAMDLEIPNALPTMLCRPPKINGTALAILNKSAVLAMDGVTDVAVIPNTAYSPGGAGEFGVAASMAAVANAYARATGTMPATFPINHNQPLGFTPYPTVPPIPQSPTDELTESP
jgi:CO/xanthine dehydrogenase Mo-binding subunit